MSARSELPADLETRIVEILDADTDGQDAAIDALCRAHPAHADGILGRVAAARLASQAASGTAAAAFETLAANGSSFGPFRLLERLARGGMGVVWLAEQQGPVRRKVALKVMDQRARDPEFAARFAVERTALALLQHPHIAKVLDAGTTDGTPWLAIEFVASRQSITDYCCEHELGVRERLALFVMVCDAVQHAHSRGILHRDLKPANVLVDTSGRSPSPKVIDFGIAKLTGGGADAAFATRAGALLGTSVYMSPEQARGDLDLDVRTDVYALGGLLHELLTGEYPGEEHDLAKLFRHDLPRFLKIVTTGRLSPPSRRVAAPWLARRLRGDLDAIVLRAMHKQRERRYDSAAELLRDVERYLRGEPVAARGDGIGYRLKKLAARHALALGAAAALLALGGFGVVSVLRSNAALELANAELAERNRELEEARAATNTAAEQARASAQQALALQREAEQQREAADAARGDAEAAQAKAEAALAAARQAEQAVAAQAQRLRNEADAAEEAGIALADLLADESETTSTITVAAWTTRVRGLLDGNLPVWPPAVERRMRQTIAWLAWGLGDHVAAREQFEILATKGASDPASRLERAATLHALGDAVSADSRSNIAALREAAGILRDEGVHARDPQLLRIEGDLAFQLLQSPEPGDRNEGRELIIGCLCRALDMPNVVVAKLRFGALIGTLERDTAMVGLDKAVEQVDTFLAPILAESMLRSRLCNIFWAAARYPELAEHRELVLRCALRYGVNLNGRGHPHTNRVRLELAAAIATRADAAGDAARRAEVFELLAQQADIALGFGRRLDLTGLARPFAGKVDEAVGAAAPAEFARIAERLRPGCRADNPIVALLAELGRP